MPPGRIARSGRSAAALAPVGQGPVQGDGLRTCPRLGNVQREDDVVDGRSSGNGPGDIESNQSAPGRSATDIAAEEVLSRTAGQAAAGTFIKGVVLDRAESDLRGSQRKHLRGCECPPRRVTPQRWRVLKWRFYPPRVLFLLGRLGKAWWIRKDRVRPILHISAAKQNARFKCFQTHPGFTDRVLNSPLTDLFKETGDPGHGMFSSPRTRAWPRFLFVANLEVTANGTPAPQWQQVNCSDKPIAFHSVHCCYSYMSESRSGLA